MFKTFAFTAALVLLAAAPAFAQDDGSESLKVGDDAPSISVEFWLNTPTFTDFASLTGDVVFLKAWGIS